MSAGSARALCCALGFALLPAGPAGAQVVLDGTAGPSGALPGPDFAIGADLGTRSGDNLFHSFSRFDVETGGSATFSGPDAIRHVIGRVTGGTRSTIDGALRSTVAGADLWLINPAGMLFGPNASLDVQGSFHVSTADELSFADGARFSAIDPAASSFASAPPEAFGFLGAGRAPIDVQGAILNVPPGAVLSLTGGDIALIDGAQLAAVSFGSDDAGEVRIKSDGVLTLSGQFSGLFAGSLATTPDSGEAGAVVIHVERLEMRDGALIEAVTQGGGAGGRIEVEAEAIVQESGSQIAAWTAGGGEGGSIELRLTGTLQVLDQARIDARSFGVGDAGHISIEAQRVELDGNSRIETNSFGGRAGAITIATGTLRLAGGGQIANSAGGLATEPGGDLVVRASEEIVIVGLDPATGFRSGLFSDALGNADAGDIVITTPSLTVDGGRITTDASDEAFPGEALRGDAGDVIITVGELVVTNEGQIFAGTNTAGDGGEVQIDARSVVIVGTADAPPDASLTGDFTGLFSNVKEGGSGSGGRIVITADELALRDDGRISTRTLGTGAAGAVEIHLTGTLVVDGSIVESAVVSLAGVDLPAGEETTGGALTLAAERVLLVDGGTISARSERGPGAAGEITLSAPQSLELRGGTITSTAVASGGGRIVIEVGELIDLERSAIATSVFGGEDTTAGDIVIDPRFMVLDRSDIVAQAQAGQGGNIDITVLHLFRSPTSRIDASAATGIDGTVEVSSPDADIAGDLVVLAGAFVDAAALLRARCEARRDVGASSLTGVGRGGLPPSPDGPLASAAAPPSVAEIPGATALLVLSCAGPA
jgi:filamentous hemagglutinin family protein